MTAVLGRSVYFVPRVTISSQRDTADRFMAKVQRHVGRLTGESRGGVMLIHDDAVGSIRDVDVGELIRLILMPCAMRRESRLAAELLRPRVP